MIRRFRAAWAAFLNPPPRWAVKTNTTLGTHVISCDLVTRDDADAVIRAIARRAREVGRPPRGLA